MLVGGCITAVQNGIGMVRMLNFKPYPITLKRNLLIASIIFPDNVSSITPFKTNNEHEKSMHVEKPSTEVLESFVAEYKLNSSLKLTPEQRNELMNVLYQNRDVFAREISEIKTYKNFELKLKSRSWDIKSYTRQYKLPEYQAEEAHRQIEEMKKQGLVTESEDCTYNSPVFMVAKKNSQLRMVCDLRKINHLLKPFVIQLPKIDQILNDIAAQNPQVLTTIDMYKGYHSIRLSPKTNQLTAFCSPKTGQSYVWQVLPVGLSASSGAFVYVINKLFQDKEKFPYLFYYIDDCLISSSSFSEHLKHLNAVFATLRTNSLTVNPSKTCAGFDEIEFLGHTVSSKGVRISDSKTQAIRKITAPSTRRSLQRLLGLLQYFRKHVSNYSARTYNMRQLLKQDSKFQWTEQCENELQDLKNALINAPILAPFRADRKVYIYTDGSLYGLGACCLQMNNLNQPEICSYMSLSLIHI